MAKTITVIPQTRNLFTTAPIATAVRRRVAGYARVSTDSDEQFTSYEAQIDYYANFIKSKPEWDFVRVYTDEGISATNTTHRDGFNEMIADALGGQIDLIVTKSVSRFARNTVDSLTTIRKLKEHGVECYFEKENIWTFDSKGELLITIMSSLAQEESRSISENVTWGQRKRFADGKVSMPYAQFLGYEKGPEGTPVVNREQALIVHRIYNAFLDGKTPLGICRMLESEGIPAPGGGKKWYAGTITSILTNEKYKGDALLQKCFTTDFLTKKQKVNEGEVPQYYVEGSHEAIIDPIEFDYVQAEIARRKRVGRSYSGDSVFASRIICGDCGGHYGPKVWHSNDSYRKVIWRCNRKFSKGQQKCQTPTVNEETIKKLFLEAYNIMMGNREQLLGDCKSMYEALADFSDLDARIKELTEEIRFVSDMSAALIKQHATQAESEEEYNKHRAELVTRYEKAQAELEQRNVDRQLRLDQRKKIKRFIDTLKDQPLVLPEWNEQLWARIVESVTLYSNGKADVRFVNGICISVDLP